MRMTLRTAAECTGGQVRGPNAEFDGVSIDSRTLRPKELFVALCGNRLDGHAFLWEACARGAAAAMVSRDAELQLPMLRVENTRLGLGRLASAQRRQQAIPVISVTGSSGKTTVKEMLATILALEGPTLATRGNQNNDLGVPLTLLRLEAQHRFAVIELGANHPGEIGYVSQIARPSVAIITNAGPAHLEGFGDLPGVARAKGEIFTGLSARGIAVLNADDPQVEVWREMAGAYRQIDFGLENAAQVRARQCAIGEKSHFTLQMPHGSIEVSLPLPGRHNVLNALAASAGAWAVGVDLETIRVALEQMSPISGRQQSYRGEAGTRIIDDTYNANPASLQAATEVLAAYPGERVLVLGDMAELGERTPDYHRVAGAQARAAGIDRLFAVGEMAALAAHAFGQGARHFTQQEALIKAVRSQLHAGMTVMVKGSRCMHMERVVEALCQG